MASEKKSVSVPVADQEKEIAKMAKSKWACVGYDFAPEGLGHVTLRFERVKKAKK